MYSNSIHILKIFFLQTKKTHHMVINFNISAPDKYIVFNGPGFLSEVLKDNINQTVVSSTFQCIVQLLSMAINLISNFTFSYLSINIKVSPLMKLVQFQNSTIYLPQRKHLNIQIIHVYAKNNYQVNITISNYMSTIDISPHCSFGGLHFLEMIENQKDKTVCSSSDIGRNFYSYNSSLTLVYYQYKNYDRVQIEVQVSQTSCKHIEVNVYHFYNHCFYILTPCYYESFSRNEKNCNLYLRNVSSHLNSSLFIEDNSISLKSNEEHCIILQFMCLFESLSVGKFGTVKAPVKRPLRVKFSLLSNNSKINEVKMSLHKKFPMDTYIYKEFCMQKPDTKLHVNSINLLGYLHYEINNLVPDNMTVIRQLTNKKCKITNYFTHQTKNWLEIKIISAAEFDILSSYIVAKKYLLKENLTIDKDINATISQMAVLFFNLSTAESHSGQEPYSLDVVLEHFLSTSGGKYIWKPNLYFLISF